MKKLVYGVGINDADYAVQPTVNGKVVVCPAYRAWKDMLMRCYSAKYQEKRPTYINTTICKEWRSFMAFRVWWLDNHVSGWQLDKDIIGKGEVYSPSTCIYIPSWLNNFTTDHGAVRGELPIGVCYHKQNGKYKARCNHPFGKRDHLGVFSDPNDAYQAWLNRKLEIAAELKQKMDEIDERIYHSVIDIIINLK